MPPPLAEVSEETRPSTGITGLGGSLPDEASWSDAEREEEDVASWRVPAVESDSA